MKEKYPPMMWPERRGRMYARNEQMRFLFSQGTSRQELADDFGLTRRRVNQILASDDKEYKYVR